MRSAPHAHTWAHSQRKPWAPSTRGWVLPVLLLLMALMGTLVLSLWRSAITRESLARADADRLQARQAARALIREAQRDIQASTPESRHSPGAEGSTQAFYPRDMADWPRLTARLQHASGLACQQGICLSLTSPETGVATWVSRLSGAASPGQFMPRASGADSAFTQLYPGTAAYWVELLPFDTVNLSTSSRIEVTPGRPSLVYRITAYAQGRLAGTRVVQQVLWLANTQAPERANAPRVLQWREWLE